MMQILQQTVQSTGSIKLSAMCR